MRFPRVRFRFRFRLRTLMILVAVVAVGIGVAFEVVRLTKLRDHYRFLAGHHARHAANCENGAANAENALNHMKEFGALVDGFIAEAATPERRKKLSAKRVDIARMTAVWKRRLPAYRALVRYHSNLNRKYAHAAARPWTSVAPDPPAQEYPDQTSVGN